MTALPIQRKSSVGKLFLLFIVVVGTLLLVSLPPLNGHATGKHGNEAVEVWNWVKRNGDFCEYKCEDGRIRYVCEMPDGFFAIVVLAVITTWAGAKCIKKRILVTAFKGDPHTAESIKKSGKNTYSYHQNDCHS